MIPVVFISDENFIMQTHIAIRSLVLNKDVDTCYDIYVIMAECPDDRKAEIEVLQNEQVNINFVEASLDEFRDINQIAHIPISCLLKFKICDLINQYDKLIYLDGDIYVRGDLRALYDVELESAFAAAVTSVESIYGKERKINAGIMLFNAKRMREQKMSEQLIRFRKELGDRGSMDQQTFNLILGNQMIELPCIFNCIPYKIIGKEKKRFPIEKLNMLYGTKYESAEQMVEDAVIIHYATGEKPWKYTFIPCSYEWYSCYKSSIYGNKKLRRDTKIIAHIKGVIRNAKKGGMKGIWQRMQEYLGKNDSEANNWG